MSTAESSLPVFKKPPVVETVLGVQFDPVPGFSNAHLGAFWKWLLAHEESSSAKRWKKLADAPPIELAFERFEESQSWSPSELMVRVAAFPPARLQIRNDAMDAMIQVQNTRFHYNWIGQQGQDYSRYARVRPAFDSLYEQFRAFLREEQLGDPKENQWEITYVNNIPKGTVWTAPNDWASLFVGLPGPWVGPPDVELEGAGGSWHFKIAPDRGRLHIDLKHARIDGPAPREVLRLNLTARGPVGDHSAAGTSLSDGLDLGRRVVVTTFTCITSVQAHRFWERIQ